MEVSVPVVTAYSLLLSRVFHPQAFCVSVGDVGIRRRVAMASTCAEAGPQEGTQCTRGTEPAAFITLNSEVQRGDASGAHVPCAPRGAMRASSPGSGGSHAPPHEGQPDDQPCGVELLLEELGRPEHCLTSALWQGAPPESRHWQGRELRRDVRVGWRGVLGQRARSAPPERTAQHGLHLHAVCRRRRRGPTSHSRPTDASLRPSPLARRGEWFSAAGRRARPATR